MADEKLSFGINDSQLEYANSVLQECIDNCTECSRMCLQLIPYCLDMGGEHASSEHIGTLQVCSIMCEACAKLMTLESEFHHDLCRLCAQICITCAIDCERLADDNPLMIDCAEICRKAAESCERMSAH